MTITEFVLLKMVVLEEYEMLDTFVGKVLKVN